MFPPQMPPAPPLGAPPLGAPPPQAPLTQTSGSLPLPAEADLAFWRDEVHRSEDAAKPYHTEWQENVDAYAGRSVSALASAKTTDQIAVPAEFYQVEQKVSQLFYETPELQLAVKGGLMVQGLPGQPSQPIGPPAPPQGQAQGPANPAAAIVQAHRDLLNEILGPEQADVLSRAVLPAIKDCLTVSGTGPVIVGYQPTLKSVPAPQMPGQILGLQADTKVPIHEAWYALRFSPKKLLIPAEFHDTDWDKAPWLGMKFRMPLTLARREFADVLVSHPDFAGTTTRDEQILNEADKAADASRAAYVDGTAIWYRAALYDPAAVHPELYRELVLIDGIDDAPARHRDSPHQTIGPDGRMTADSLIGNPIHPLTIRSLPDSAYVPSDSQMTRPLVKELNKFRTQMVQERDANKPRFGYDAEKFPPEVIAKIEAGEVGTMIPLEPGVLAQGMKAAIDVITQGGSPRQTYVANDYIEKDIAKILAIGANQTSVSDSDNRSATEISVMDRAANVRLDAERRQVLRWYLKLVYKMSALLCRYMTPQLATTFIGAPAAQAWGQWDKKASDGRMAFSAKPDSQIRLDAAAERKFALDLYQMTAKDPNVSRVELLKNLFMKAGYDPSRLVVEQLPQKGPDENFSFRFGGEDLIGPQAPLVREILAQGGIQLSEQAINDSAGQMFKQVALGLRDASGKAVPAQSRPAQHGGPADQVQPLSKHQADQTGAPSGPKVAA